MSSWALADLRREHTWDIDVIGLRGFSWPSSAPLRGIDEVAQVLTPFEDSEPGYPVITPRGIDNVTGVLRRRERGYVGPAFRVGGYGRALQPGDLLVPPSDVPALYVNETMTGSVVSSQFLAIRPESVDAYWLWGVLNCRSGRRLRRLLTAGLSGKPEAQAAIRRMRIPTPSSLEQSASAQRLAAIERGMRSQEVEAPTTWWKATDLRRTQWRFALASANPALLQDGEPLGNYCQIMRGRQSRLRENGEHLSTGEMLPLATGMYLAGRRNELAPLLPDSILAQPGDVLAAVIGDRPLAQVVDQPMILSNTTFLLHPYERDSAPAIAKFLNSPTGLARWRFLALDGVAPQMRLSDLREFPVPYGALDEQTDMVAPPGPLDAQLEGILWPS